MNLTNNKYIIFEIFVLCTFLLFTNIKADFNATETCLLIKNGTKIKDPTACNRWFECINEEAIVHTCNDKDFYDRTTGNCVAEKSIKCITSSPCLAVEGTGFVADPYSCENYYYCNNGSAILGTCKDGWNFNPNTISCILNGTCDLGMNPDSYCNIVPDGIFIQNTTDCSNYQMCWKEVLINASCPNGYFLDAFNGVCTDDFSSGICVQDTNPNEGTINCTTADTFISDGYSCNGYYYCRELSDGTIEPVHQNCGQNYFFSAINGGLCVNRTQISCPYDTCAGMGLNYIQLANLSDDDCHGYAICQNGASIGTGICPENEYFDEIVQLCTNNTISYPACVLS